MPDTLSGRTSKRKAKTVRGHIEHGCVSGRSTDVVGTDGFTAAGFRQGDAVRVMTEARYRELLAAERRALELDQAIDLCRGARATVPDAIDAAACWHTIESFARDTKR